MPASLLVWRRVQVQESSTLKPQLPRGSGPFAYGPHFDAFEAAHMRTTLRSHLMWRRTTFRRASLMPNIRALAARSCGLTRNRTPKWGVERPRRWGRVRQDYLQVLVSSKWDDCVSPTRSPCVRRRMVVTVASERPLMAEAVIPRSGDAPAEARRRARGAAVPGTKLRLPKRQISWSCARRCRRRWTQIYLHSAGGARQGATDGGAVARCPGRLTRNLFDAE